jgi:putative Mg2+ transporter-C (MgtC) family protein
MIDLIEEFGRPTWLPFSVIAARLLFAALLGAAIGFTRVDPIRIVEAVTAGVAFLAAGTILFARGEVQGLTTGAGMWLAGAVGVACGLGLWQIAALGTAIVLVVMGLMVTFQARAGRAESRKDAAAGPRPAAKARDA